MLIPALEKASTFLLGQQFEEGYWWYSLESNESIGAGFIQLMHFLGGEAIDPEIQAGLIRRMISKQNKDGSWSLFYGAPGELSITVECYFAMKLAGGPVAGWPVQEAMEKAKRFILKNGGLLETRAFTRIHLALFGLVPWSSCPMMPSWVMLLPNWSGFSIYEFCSWARASIVPLLLVYDKKPVRPLPFDLDELFQKSKDPKGRKFSFPRPERFFSLENFFIQSDKVLKLLDRLPWHPGKKKAIEKAVRWTREHVARTEDIYPAMAYAALGLKAQGFPNNDPTIAKAMKGLKRFQEKEPDGGIHQQACISPIWDTPWVSLALLEAGPKVGITPAHPALLKAARYLISKEISHFRGDWTVKNRQGPAGGWAFEFENDYFPDVDDTIRIIIFLKKSGLPEAEKKGAIERGLAWLLSMQSKNGGWGAFDKNNLADWVNQIPFSDHGACLDPPTADLTARMLELLALFDYPADHPVCRKAIAFLKKNQEPDGSWKGRWAVNHINGTWCALNGLIAIGEDKKAPYIRRAVEWLKSIQNADGGWGESCFSDAENRYVPLNQSTASQTAWGLMGLIAAGERESAAVQKAVRWLMETQTKDGGWNEEQFTGTGFPGHFYLRYHGYRYYYPLLGLATYASSDLKS
jgi:squalene-hopene/tetraprenyl-beta-curcumene cyclase